MNAAIAQLLAALMTAAHGVIWMLASRWERPGRDARLRTRLHPPTVIGRGGDLAQVAPLLYPVFVVVAPGWGVRRMAELVLWYRSRPAGDRPWPLGSGDGRGCVGSPGPGTAHERGRPGG